MTRLLIGLLFLLSFDLSSQTIQIEYPVIAHAHNDYNKFQPIYNALDHGFTSLEVDVVYVEGLLKVSHDFKKLSRKPEFESGYLKPFLEAEKSLSPYILLVDLKNYSEDGVELLHQILSKYAQHLVSRKKLDDKVGKVQILLSGAYPRVDIINTERYEYFFIDGRPEHVNSGISPDMMPWISTNFKHHFLRKRKGRHAKTEEQRLERLVKEVHDAGYQLRFWRTPDKRVIWKMLVELEVDIIGVDKVRKFHRVMLQLYEQ